MKKIDNIRIDYNLNTLNKSDLLSCPLKQFELWFNEVVNDIIEPTAMIISTYCTKYGCQSRVVLLKELRYDGFVFFTNYNSLKAKQINLNNNVSLTFFWPNFQRQIRINGLAKKISDSESVNYFKQRPRGSQISTWVSDQSQIIGSRDDLDLEFKKIEKRFKDQAIPKPPNWGGYLIQPKSVEFWQGRQDRMHDRILYLKNKDTWIINRLAP
tara:strand:+ start:321 stop:956 length:636 start_codon:yes stop_codon:yes gene_type:complete